jgi:hypothetical protein
MPSGALFEPGRLTEFGLPQARGQPPIGALRECTVDEEPEAFLEAERRDGRHLELFDQGVGHTGKFQGLQFVECGMREPEGFPLSSS